ncbi:uncharacterized protein LOC135338866 isoform X3 [Halichondria panicea]|uniref:uncharacterized protein LOC135338866 isoform X3 n=1 Tax=Halichondria panicea TaxID=6063 RepID=UPI00312B7DDF
MESAVSKTTVLYVLVGLFLTTTSIEAQQFIIEPESVVQAEGLLAEFECLSPGLAHSWFVNNTPSTSFTPEIRVLPEKEGRPSVLTIPAGSQFNNTVVQCAAVSSITSVTLFSRNAALIVERVSIEVVNDKTKITITVKNDFTTNNVTYHVNISLMTLGTNSKMVALPPLNGAQNEVEFNYEQTNNHTLCDIFTFTVTPISESGMEGSSSEPVTGFFTTVTGNNNVAPLISQGGNVSRKIVNLGGMVPNCTNFTSYQVTSDILAPINKTIEDLQMINFSLPTDRIINVSVTLTSITGVRLIFKDMLIKTTDVQNLIVGVCPKENCASIEYVEGTLSPGALVCVIPNGNLSFQNIRLVSIRRDMSDNFTIPVAVSGNYSVIAFDLENNSIPRMPSIVADDETMFLSNKSSTEPISPLSSEDITVTKLSNGSAEVTCTISGHSCLALFQSKTSPTSPTSLDQVVVGFIKPSNNRTIVPLNATSDVYAVVYTWNSDSGETIFDGKVSFISELELPTRGPPPTQSAPLSMVPIVVVVTLVIVGAIILIILVILVILKRDKRGKVLHYNHESDSQGRSTNIVSQELDVGARITKSREVIALCNVARPGNMSLECKTADTDDTPPPGYDVVCIENMQSPEYETVASAKAGKPTPTTSENPPPLSPPMIRGDSEAPDLPPAYDPAVDNESAVVMSVESSISQGVENQSVDGEVDESSKKDLSISDMEHHRTEEAIGSTEAQGVYTMDESVQGSEDGSSNSADYGEKKAMIAAQDVGASITFPVAFYDIARPENMSLECITADTDDTPPPGYDVVRKENMQSPEYETIASAKAGKPTPITSENPPPLPPPMIKRDEGLDNDGVLTEETTDSTAQAKDEPTENGGDSSGYEAKIAAQHQYVLVEHKPSDKVIMKDSSKVIYSEVDKDKLKPVVPPPALPPRRPDTNTEELHTEKTLALPPRHPVTNTEELHTEKTQALAPRQRHPPPPPIHETSLITV